MTNQLTSESILDKSERIIIEEENHSSLFQSFNGLSQVLFIGEKRVKG